MDGVGGAEAGLVGGGDEVLLLDDLAAGEVGAVGAGGAGTASGSHDDEGGGGGGWDQIKFSSKLTFMYFICYCVLRVLADNSAQNISSRKIRLIRVTCLVHLT